MFAEDDLLPLSAIQHFLFCQRQCALIHIEQLWEENPFTIEGKLLHKPVEEEKRESRGDVRIVRGMAIRSLRLGLAGKADVIEFHRAESQEATSGFCISLPDKPGWWRPFPIEYKRGRPKPGKCDEAQLCAQAMCLEEMMNIRIMEGALFYYSIRRRKDVSFDDSLRLICEEAAIKLRSLLESRITPPAVYDSRCKHCSMIELCSPRLAESKKSALAYLEDQIE
jgi:CRISPR-associated exonuclease Cas4